MSKIEKFIDTALNTALEWLSSIIIFITEAFILLEFNGTIERGVISK